MGHDVHFLQRLDRVSDAHVELALTLYRDEALLREVLGRAGLPDGAERLAISLDDPVEGPFVVVTRAGRFVTCLGRGMRLDHDPLPVLTRDRLDAAAGRVQRMRDDLAQVKRLRDEGGEGVAARAFRRMQEDGLAFPREEMETLLSVQPLVAPACTIHLAEYQAHVQEHRKMVAYFRYDKLRPLERAYALAYARVAWAMNHYIVLTEHRTVHEAYEAMTEDPNVRLRENARQFQMQLAFDLGTYPHAYRALWGLARRPKSSLRFLKALESDSRLHWCAFREFGLGVVAAASPKVRAEALKSVTQSASARPPHVHPDLHVVSAKLGDITHRILREAEGFDAYHAYLGKRIAAQLRTGELRPPEDVVLSVPEDVGRALTANLIESWLPRDEKGNLLRLVCTALPWLARARPEELYLPEAWVDLVKPRSEEAVYAFLAPYATSSFIDRPKPVSRRAPKVGRNDPCPCGSGKKRKRCCASKTAIG